MKEEVKSVEDEADVSEEKRSLIAALGWILFGAFVVLMLVFGGVKVLRNQNPSEVSERFVQNNETVKQKTGGIVRIQGFGKRIASGDEWEMSAKIFGNENNIEVTVNGCCSGGSSDDLGGCSIMTAKYRNANDIAADWNDSDWHEIEIGWLEKQLLVFK